MNDIFSKADTLFAKIAEDETKIAKACESNHSVH